MDSDDNRRSLLAKQLQEEWDAITRMRGKENEAMHDLEGVFAKMLAEYEHSPASSFMQQSPSSNDSYMQRTPSTNSSRSTSQCPLPSVGSGSLITLQKFMTSGGLMQEGATKLFQTKQKLKNSGILVPKDANKKGREAWVADGDVTHCFGCQTQFGLTVRKHHCRECGKIFCHSCTKRKIAYTPESKACEERYREKNKCVCRPCHSKIAEAQFDLLFAPLSIVHSESDGHTKTAEVQFDPLSFGHSKKI